MELASISLALVLFGAGAAPQDVEVLRHYDLRPLLLVERWHGPPADWRSMLERARLDRLEPDGLPVPLEERALGEAVFDSAGIERFVRDVAGDLSECELDAAEGTLRVVASSDAQQRVARLVETLESRASRAAELEAFVLPGAALSSAPGSVLAPAEVDALLVAHPPLRRARGSAPLAHVARLEAGAAWRAYVIDFDVEVASYASMSDPQVTVLSDGLLLGAVVDELADGGLLLRTWGRDAQQLEARELRYDPDGDASLELPRAKSSRWAGSARLEDGGGLLLGGDARGATACLVRVRAPEREPDSPWVPLAELTAAPLVVAPPWTLGPAPSGGWRPPAEGDPLYLLDRAAPPDGDGALELVAAALGLSMEELGARALLGEAYVVEDDARARVLEGLRLVGGTRARTVEVELRYGAIEDAAELDVAALAERLEGRMRGACCVGDSLTLVAGEEAQYLQDYDVELAPSAGAADPIVELLFQGVTAWFHPTLSSSGALACVVELEHQEALGPFTRREVVFGPQREGPSDEPRDRPRRGVLEEARVQRADVSTLLQPAPGAWTLVARHSLEDGARSFVAVARFTLDEAR